MTGTLAQAISLTSFINHSLASGQTLAGYYPQHSTFQHCHLVDFRDWHDQQETELASNPTSWFSYLRVADCRKLRLYYQPVTGPGSVKPHQSAAFVGGGGNWVIQTLFDEYSNYWINRWQVTQPNDPNDKIWSVNYIRVNGKQPTTHLHYDLELTTMGLVAILDMITTFAMEKGETVWADQFKKAKSCLTSDTPEAGYYHTDLIIHQNYSLKARQVLFAAASAWVFGGMGSWNDLVFPNSQDTIRYDVLSAALYDAINRAILSAVNSF